MNILKAFYAYALLASLISIWNHINDITALPVFAGLLGIISSLLFFLKRYKFSFLGIIWIIVQIPYVVFDGFVVDMSQFLNIHLSLNIGSISIGVNAQVLLLFLLPYLSLLKHVGEKITLKPFTEKAKEVIDKAITVTPDNITEGKKLSADIEIEINNEMYHKLLFKPTKDDRLNRGYVVLFSENTKKPLKATVTFEVI